MDPLKHLPGPSALEMIRRIRWIQTHPVDYLTACARQYGDFVRFPVGTLPVFFINDPEAIQRVLQLNHRNYTKDTLQYRSLASITGNGLLTSDGEYWFGQRRRIQPAFLRPNVSKMAIEMGEIIQVRAQRLEQALPTNGVIDLDEIMLELALEIVGRSLFGVDLSREARQFVQAVLTSLDHIIARARTPLPLPVAVPTPANLRFRRSLRAIDSTVQVILAQRRAAINPPEDLLSLLLSATDPQTGQKMDDQQLRDELVTILIAGHETVASALTWTWFLLAKHPDIRNRFINELDDNLDGRPPGLSDLENLPFTRMVFEESLRLYPPAWLITRRSIGPDQLCGVDIPAGSLIIISPYTIHRHPAFWDQPDTFLPERFEKGSPAPDRPKSTYIPFGAGPRLCIGNHFATVEASLILAAFGQRFQFDLLEPDRSIPAVPQVTLRPEGGMRMRVSLRA